MHACIRNNNTNNIRNVLKDVAGEENESLKMMKYRRGRRIGSYMYFGKYSCNIGCQQIPVTAARNCLTPSLDTKSIALSPSSVTT